MKNIKARYPNKLSRDKYIIVLSNEYLIKENFSFLSKLSNEQVALPINVISGLINYMLNEDSSYKIQQLYMNTLKQLKPDQEYDEGKLRGDTYDVLYLLRGDQDTIKYYAEAHEVPLPSQEDMPQYLEFVASVASRIIDDICRETEAKIPYTAKIEYEQWMNSDKENIGATDTEQLTFAQRIEQKRKPLADAADRDNEESMPNAKKPRVTFADEVIKKKTADSSGEVEERVDDSSASTEDDSSTVTGSTDDKEVAATNRGIGVEEADEAAAGSRDITKHANADKATESSLSTITLNSLYSWLNQLPEWLQEQMLNSAPVRGLIEAARQDAAIYDNSNYTANQLANLFAGLEFHDSTNVVSGNRDNKVSIANSTSEELVDTSLILDELQVTGLILPTEAVGSAEILPEPIFNGFEMF